MTLIALPLHRFALIPRRHIPRLCMTYMVGRLDRVVTVESGITTRLPSRGLLKDILVATFIMILEGVLTSAIPVLQAFADAPGVVVILSIAFPNRRLGNV